jgi:hypothetical protein
MDLKGAVGIHLTETTMQLDAKQNQSVVERFIGVHHAVSRRWENKVRQHTGLLFLGAIRQSVIPSSVGSFIVWLVAMATPATSHVTLPSFLARSNFQVTTVNQV